MKDAPGLRWRERADGSRTPYWIASSSIYPKRCVRLDHLSTPEIPAYCRALQARMTTWVRCQRSPKAALDGTIGAALIVYRAHPKSPYQALRASSRRCYGGFARRLESEIGSVVIVKVTGLDVLQWHEQWRGLPEGENRIAGAEMALNVLKAALSFGAFCGRKECGALLETISHGKFPKPKPRIAAPDAAQVIALRDAAHRLGMPSMALALAFQFEATLRQGDVLALRWIDIRDRLLTVTPAKTSGSSAARVSIDLGQCPMILEELAGMVRGLGPVILSEATGQAYTERRFNDAWRRVRAAAGLPPSIWNRDLRAGGITEGSRGGARLEDLAKQAGHTSSRTTAEVYDRDHLEAARRVSKARQEFRNAVP